MIVDPRWVLSLMMLLEPDSPYRATFERTAAAIATGAERSPLPGQDEKKTAAVLVSVAWFESRFQVDAKGDCDRTTKFGICAEGAKPSSFGLFQINQTNHAGLRVSKTDLTEDVDKSVTAALAMMRTSFQVCRSRPLEERLAWYTAGADGCPTGSVPAKKSTHRMRKAIFLWGRPVPLTEDKSATL